MSLPDRQRNLPNDSLERLRRLVSSVFREPTRLDGGVGVMNGGDESAVTAELPADALRLLILPRASAPASTVAVHDVGSNGHRVEVPLPPDLLNGSRAAAIVPLPSGRDPSVGALAVLSHSARRWSDHEINCLEIVAETLAAEVELRRDALRDPLTGLANRALFLDRLGHAAERARRHKEFRFAVLSLDVDRFKVVNESLGWQAGDEMLTAVARSLEQCVRGEDTVARVGGDEFLILLESLADDGDAVRVAQRILGAMARPFVVGGEEVFTSASIGLVSGSTAVDKPPALIQYAEVAMGRAKRGGRARYEMFDRDMHARALRRLKAETDLHHAVERGEFVVYFQPMISLVTGRITEVEALVRWRHPERGLVPPLEFIPLAEETRLIIPIGNWVLAEACRQVRDWQRRFPRTEPLALSVNLSVREFSQPGFVRRVADTVKSSGFDARSLKLEITESFAIDDAVRTSEMLEELRGLGIRFYLDDFGTGYSSLRYLHGLPLDAIKIDRTFVTRMDAGPTHLQLVRTVRALASNIGVMAVAEGVETQEQLRTLRELGCECAQGFLFSRPVPAAELELLLEADPVW
jgi:diguanylate cyclase (GGDEF)-like protein